MAVVPLDTTGMADLLEALCPLPPGIKSPKHLFGENPEMEVTVPKSPEKFSAVLSSKALGFEVRLEVQEDGTLIGLATVNLPITEPRGVQYKNYRGIHVALGSPDNKDLSVGATIRPPDWRKDFGIMSEILKMLRNPSKLHIVFFAVADTE